MVTLDGRPERLLIHRADDLAGHLAGARLVARVRRVERPLATVFLDLGAAPDGVLPLGGAAASLSEGARIEVEVISPPRADKGPVVRLIGPAEGEPRVLVEALSLAEQLRRLAPEIDIIGGPEARAMADLAEDAALAVVHALPSGGSIAIEPTRALVAIDVDVGPAAGDARKAATRANREAITASACLLRLKGLAGAVVIDLAGKGHDGEALKAVAAAAFAPDQPGVALGPITRFGLWPLTLPHRSAPVAEILCTAAGTPTDATLALRLLREIEREAGAGGRVEAHVHPDWADAAVRLAPFLTRRIGARFRIVPDPKADRLRPTVHPWEAP